MKTLSLGIAISLLGAGSTAAAFGTVEQRVNSLGHTLDKLKLRQKTALENMDREWVWGGESIKKYAGQVEKLDARIEKLAARQSRLRSLGEQHAANRADLNSRFGDLLGAYAIGHTLAMPVHAFTEQEAAITNLQVAMMRADGTVSPVFDRIKKQIVELGNQLPGTTADYANLATTMTSLGIPADKLVGNALTAAGYLRVALNMSSEAAGETVVKLREAYNLTDDDLAKTADITQRAKFAFGMKPEDLRVAASYESAQLNTLHLTGADNMRKVLVMQGMANLKGLEGSSFGTNFSMMLTRLASGPLLIEQARRGMKKEAQKAMEEAGIEFNFFDAKGKFKGLEAMVAELGKLQIIREKLGEKTALEVAQGMFGTEASRPAMILAEYGSQGFADAQKRFDEQANLNDRMEKLLATTKNTWEAFTGSLENFAAAAAGPAVSALKPLVNWLNDATGALTEFTEKHPAAAKWLGLLAGGALAATAGFLGFGVVLAFGRYALTGLQIIPGVGTALSWLGGTARRAVAGGFNVAASAATGLWRTLAAGNIMERVTFGASGLGRALAGGLVNGFRAAAVGARMLGVTLLTTPVGWIGLAIAGAALLIWKYWAPIKGFFAGLWSGLKAGFAPVMQALSPAFDSLRLAFGNVMKALEPLMPMLKIVFLPVLLPLKLVASGVRLLWGWLRTLFTQVEDTGGAARNMGERFGKGIAGALLWAGKLLAKFLELPARLMQIGADAIGALGRGLMSMAGVARTAAQGIWNTVNSAFSGGIGGVSRLIINWSPLGLFYKAFAGVLSWFGVDLPRSFTDFGEHLITGLVDGIKAKLTAAKDTIVSFGQNIKGWFSSVLDIHSPSRVFMGFGENIGQGLEIGMARMLPIIQGAASKLAGVTIAGMAAVSSPVFAADVHAANQALPRVDSRMAAGSADAPAVRAAAASAPVAESAGGNMTIHFAPNITISGRGDASGVESQVSQAMQMSVRELEQMLRRVQAEQQRRAF